MNLQFTRATRAQVPLKLGISGPSGSGKTTAALRLARGLVGPTAPIALLDTENGSASLYADLTAFDTLNMNPPYQVAKFTASIEAAVAAGYRALIIDSASHEWKELLTEKEALDARGGNSYTNWGSISKKHEAFLAAIRNAPIHLICCLRAKDKHEIQEKDGKKAVVKLGQGSEMRDGFEYELTTSWDLAMDHSARAGKDRTRVFDGRIEPITEATGRELATWLASGAQLAENTGEAFVAPAAPVITETPAQAIQAQADLVQTQTPAISPLADAFVESIDPTPTPASDPLPDAVITLLELVREHKVPMDALGAYLLEHGQIKPMPSGAADWTTPDLATVRKLTEILSDAKRRRSFVTVGLAKYVNAA